MWPACQRNTILYTMLLSSISTLSLATSKSAKCDVGRTVREVIIRTDEMDRLHQLCLTCGDSQEEVCLGSDNVTSWTNSSALCCGNNQSLTQIITANQLHNGDFNNRNNNKINNLMLVCNDSTAKPRKGVEAPNNNSNEDDNKCHGSVRIQGDWWFNINCKNGTFVKGLKLRPTLLVSLDQINPGNSKQIQFWNFMKAICTKGHDKAKGTELAQSSVPVLGAIIITFFVVICFMVCRNFKIKSVMGTKSISENLMKDGGTIVDHDLDVELKELGDVKFDEVAEYGVEAIPSTEDIRN